MNMMVHQDVASVVVAVAVAVVAVRLCVKL